jgi:FAD synthase
MFDGLSPGIYYGFAGIEGKDMIYKAAVSIGFNPTYNNSEKTCEVRWSKE